MSYLNSFFRNPQQIIDVIVHELFNPILGRVDVIVGRGTSGILPLMSVSIRTNIPALVVRKTNEDSHSSRRIEGFAPSGDWRYVIIDDQIDSGSTVRTILDEVKGECVGIILYSSFFCYGDRYSQFEGSEIPVVRLGEDVSELIKIHKDKENQSCPC